MCIAHLPEILHGLGEFLFVHADAAVGDNKNYRIIAVGTDAEEYLATLEGHGDNVEGVQVLADGRMLSWSDDRTLRLWSGEGKAISMWAYPPAPITQVLPHTTVPGRFWVCAGKEVFLVENTEMRRNLDDGKSKASSAGR
ncbi:MAG: WD40 repeat domain-containing protein [Rhodospirillales bacterium]|nr:WD40 repeat domain-containing protein [Rhodospirillales bacterium]MDP7215515.1 WD40 repeat domain-containing protein [Rhodospirillales bacterium]HJP54348.1 WD40 repeat domain-containing protein [Rhodospirillales bacterium]